MFTPQLQSTEMERAIQQLAELMGQQAIKHDEEILKVQNRMIDQLWEPQQPQEQLFKKDVKLQKWRRYWKFLISVKMELVRVDKDRWVEYRIAGNF